MVLERSLASAIRPFNRMFALLRTSRAPTHNSWTSAQEGVCGQWMRNFETVATGCWLPPRGTSRWKCTNMPSSRSIRSKDPTKRVSKRITCAAMPCGISNATKKRWPRFIVPSRKSPTTFRC
jgi:hypothetical protein